MIENVLDKLRALFSEGEARFRIVEHPACDRSSASVAQLRGTELGQGAKALVCMVKGNGVKQYVLAVLPADYQADLSVLAKSLGGTRAGLCSAGEVSELTGCIFGAVPPVSFHEKLLNVVDPALFMRYEEIAFNAGSRDTSIIINAKDFERIVNPRKIAFAKAPQTDGA